MTENLHTTRAEIDLSALKSNLDNIRKHVGAGVKVMGVVKANSYGHGSSVVPAALERFGIDYFGVSSLYEGSLLRNNGIKGPILVLGGVLPEQIEDCFRQNLHLTMHSFEMAKQVDAVAAKFAGSDKPQVHLNIDTGMGRFGTRYEHGREFIGQVMTLKNIRVIGLYSHFATSDNPDKTYAREQLSRFVAAVRFARDTGYDIPFVHMANSGGVLDIPDSLFTMVRPGIMLYGTYPAPMTSASVPVQPVLTLKSKVNFIKEVPAESSISYSRRYITRSRTRIATIPIGYGDGYPRGLTNNAPVLIGGKRYYVAGAITMDQIMVDVGMESNVRIGDEAVLIGRQGNESVSAWELATLSGTIAWDIFTGITERVPRIGINTP